MTRTLTTALATLAVVLAASAAAAQSRTAEVRTWDGLTYQVTDPALEVFYTIAPPPKEGSALPEAEKRQTTAGRAGLMVSLEALKPLVERKAEVAIQHHRPAETVTLWRDGVEVSVPVERLASLTFVRHPVASTLPPYVAGQHRRHTAVAVLTDGSRVEGDVNLGATWVRGTTAQGRVDLPWDRVEFIRFR